MKDIRYLAGVIDGEGTVRIVKRKQYKKKVKSKLAKLYTVQLMIPNSDMRLITWLLENYNGFYNSQKRRGENWKIVHVWILNGLNAYKLLKEVREYLLLKQEQSDLCIMMYEKMNMHRHFCRRYPKPSWAVNYQEDCFQRCKVLNRRGYIKEEDEEEDDMIIEEEDIESQQTLGV